MDETDAPDSLPFDDDMLESRSIGSLVNDSITSVPSATSIREAAATLNAGDISLIVLGGRDKIEGVASERDIVRAVAEGIDLDTTPISTVASRDLLWATPESTIGQVAEEMMENYVRHILIVSDDGSTVGVVSMRDVLTEYLV